MSHTSFSVVYIRKTPVSDVFLLYEKHTADTHGGQIVVYVYRTYTYTSLETGSGGAVGVYITTAVYNIHVYTHPSGEGVGDEGVRACWDYDWRAQDSGRQNRTHGIQSQKRGPQDRKIENSTRGIRSPKNGTCRIHTQKRDSQDCKLENDTHRIRPPKTRTRRIHTQKTGLVGFTPKNGTHRIESPKRGDSPCGRSQCSQWRPNGSDAHAVVCVLREALPWQKAERERAGGARAACVC